MVSSETLRGVYTLCKLKDISLIPVQHRERKSGYLKNENKKKWNTSNWAAIDKL